MSFPLLIAGLQLTTSTADQPPWRIGANQRDDQGALGFCDASLAASARAIAKPIESLLVEAMDAFSDRFWVAPQLRSDLRGAKSIPAEGDHLSAHFPVCWSVTASCKLADFPRFFGTLRGPGVQQLRHDLLLPRPVENHEFMFTSFKERSIRSRTTTSTLSCSCPNTDILLASVVSGRAMHRCQAAIRSYARWPFRA